MKKVLITGSRGFIGKNLSVALSRLDDLEVTGYDLGDDISTLEKSLKSCDIIYHLAGVNRPENVEEFETGHAGFTSELISSLRACGRTPAIVMSSSIQADLDNPYGVSKRKAEDLLFEYQARTGAPVFIYRLTNVFGKWCRPNYNSVVATFCNNIARNLPITISNPAREMNLIYIDDVIASFIGRLGDDSPGPKRYHQVQPGYSISIESLADLISRFRESRKTLVLPDMSDEFTRKLYATYLSYLEPDNFSYQLQMKTDLRGALAELIKSSCFGQIFVSRTHAGIIRGNHSHDTKAEKFCVLQGEALIRFRNVLSDQIISYRVSDAKWEVVDIPPGYTHSIENISDREMIVLFWANEIFDPQDPDTFFSKV